MKRWLFTLQEALVLYLSNDFSDSMAISYDAI